MTVGISTFGAFPLDASAYIAKVQFLAQTEQRF